MASEDVYIYWFRVPESKSDAFIKAILGVDPKLLDEDHLRIMHTPDETGEDD